MAPTFPRRTLLVGAAAAAASACVRIERLRVIKGVRLGRHAGRVKASAFLDDASAVTAGDRGEITFWDVRARKRVRAIRAPGDVGYLDFVWGDPSRLVVMCFMVDGQQYRHRISVLDAATGRELRRIEEDGRGPGSICGMAAMPQSCVLVSYDDRAVPDSSRLLSLDSGAEVGRHGLAAEQVTPDRSLALHQSLIWSIDGQREGMGLPVSRVTWGVAIAPDGRRAVSQTSRPYLWDASGVVNRFADQKAWLWSGAFTRDGRLLLTGSERLLLRDGRSGNTLARLDGSRGKVLTIATSPDGRHALSGDASGNVVLWQLPGGRRG